MTNHGKLFFFNDAATTEIYTLSLHDALPIFDARRRTRKEVLFDTAQEDSDALDERVERFSVPEGLVMTKELAARAAQELERSEEHTSELKSRQHLVCRLLLEKKQLTTLYRHT